MLILGIDPSSTRTGVALLEYLQDQPTLLRCDSFRINGPNDTLSDRIDEIASQVGGFLRNIVPPRTVYIERPFISPIASKHGVVTQCACYGAIIAVVRSVHPRSRVVEVGPSEVKKHFTGKGNATKDEVAACVLATFNIEPVNHDVADAVAIAVAGHVVAGLRIELPRAGVG